mmetsp:Transcript_21218/g.29321  ORF Transcript_21218/g.29321 Transcript_21218/m.29321 type:complete len:82 (-) Transcript_21218:153-398(-)
MSNQRNFLSCANETSVKLWDIQEPGHESALTISGAHSDHIRKIQVLPGNEDYLVTASADQMVKLWDLRNCSKAVDSMRLEQ